MKLELFTISVYVCMCVCIYFYVLLVCWLCVRILHIVEWESCGEGSEWFLWAVLVLVWLTGLFLSGCWGIVSLCCTWAPPWASVWALPGLWQQQALWKLNNRHLSFQTDPQYNGCDGSDPESSSQTQKDRLSFNDFSNTMPWESHGLIITSKMPPHCTVRVLFTKASLHVWWVSASPLNMYWFSMSQLPC